MSAFFYHGTSLEIAEKILDERRFKASSNAYDWLGPGVYFYQDAPMKALAWAQKFAIDKEGRGSIPKVLKVQLDLSKSFDVFSPENHVIIREAHELASGEKKPRQQRPILRREDNKQFRLFRDRALPRETEGGFNFQDAESIRVALNISKEHSDKDYNCVRSCFWEGKELYAGSYFFDHSNLQACIPAPKEDGKTYYIGFDHPIFLSEPEFVIFDGAEEEMLRDHIRWPI